MSSNTTNGLSRAYDSAVLAAEGIRQTAVMGASSQAAVTNAEIIFFSDRGQGRARQRRQSGRRDGGAQGARGHRTVGM
jgi:hypothetical protein